MARAIKLRLDELPNLHCSLMATDLLPGDNWEARIREAVRECDAIACLVTPDYINRPWFYAEWAAFWMQEKPWYILLLGTELDQLFEPMRRRQAARLDDRRSVQRFLDALLTDSHEPRMNDLDAAEIVDAVAHARRRQAKASAEADLLAFAASLQSGSDNVDAALIGRLLDSGRELDIVEVASSTTINRPSDVKLRQSAVLLVERRRPDLAAQFARLIVNNAERRTVGCACARVLGAAHDDATLELLFEIYASVRDPQRANLKTCALDAGLSIDWPVVEPRP